MRKTTKEENLVDNRPIRMFSSAPMVDKNQIIQIVPKFMDVYCAVIHTLFLSENFLSATVTHSNDLLINVSRYTGPSLVFGMNTSDHVNVVFGK